MVEDWKNNSTVLFTLAVSLSTCMCFSDIKMFRFIFHFTLLLNFLNLWIKVLRFWNCFSLKMKLLFISFYVIMGNNRVEKTWKLLIKYCTSLKWFVWISNNHFSTQNKTFPLSILFVWWIWSNWFINMPWNA